MKPSQADEWVLLLSLPLVATILIVGLTVRLLRWGAQLIRAEAQGEQ